MGNFLLHQKATASMKNYYFRFAINPYGKYDSFSPNIEELKRHNKRLIQANKTNLGDTNLELQKMLFINTIDSQILHPNWKARDITLITAMRLAIISDLDAGIESLYNPLSYKLQTSSNYIR